MDSASRPPYATAGLSHWQRFSQATVRGFHRYATWLVSLSWTRFIIYAIALIAAAGIISEMPPFSWKYTETTTVDGHRHRNRTPSVPLPPPPAPPASAALPALPAPAASAASGAEAPVIHITRTPGAGGNGEGPQKSVNIRLPGLVIDTRGRDANGGTDVKGDAVNISIGPDGIHIEDGGDKKAKGDDTRSQTRALPPAAQAAASAAAARAEAAQLKADAARIRQDALRSAASSLDRRASDAALPASDGQRVVEMTVDGRHVRIAVPANARDEDVKQAIEDARDQIVEQIKDASEQAREAADAAKEAADAQREALAEAQRAANDGEFNPDDDTPTTRTHTVRYGESLPLMAFWWVVFSLITKLAYKGRLQAETKAAVMAETAEAESLRRQVIEARMAMMQAQVEPHFLFNTLASIDHLIEVDPKRASRMQRNLIALLRASMPTMREASDGGTRPLEREMAVIRPYLEILQVRMEERLTYSVDVPDGLNSAEFPPMMIQTLVENAIKHGLEPKPEGGHLSVKAEIRHGKLVVTVADTGLGFSKAEQGTTATAGTGVGLANVRERLAMLYGTRASLTVSDNPGGGTIATITVPYTTRTAEEGAPA